MSASTAIATASPGFLAGPGGRALALAAVLTVTVIAWSLARRRAGAFHTPAHHHTPRSASDTLAPASGPPTRERLVADDLGSPLGGRGTFVLFSTTMCSTCPQVRRMLAALTSEEPGLTVADVDAEHRLDLTRRHGVYRTPTVLLLDPDGALVARTSGPVTRAQANDALLLLDTHARRTHV